jgi:FKBP-type peptidyl-prolyl cis-trans isomerase 2
MVEKSPSRIVLAILIVIVIAAAGAGAALVYELNKPKAAAPVLVVRQGDNVTVNYIGEFGSGPQTGRVFDTSIYNVAVNNGSYPKSLEYHFRGAVSNFTPLPVYVGPSAPSGGYSFANLTFQPVVTGFWQGLLGLPGNISRTIVVPPDLGYGPLNQSCVTTAPLVLTVPEIEPIPQSLFSSAFPKVTVAVGTTFFDTEFGWNDTIFAVNATTVSVQALVTLGTHGDPEGLPFVVSALNSTTITLSSELTPASAGHVAGFVSGSGVCGSTKFIVSAVSPAAGTYSANFNSEVTGETLDFIVTVIDIFPP